MEDMMFVGVEGDYCVCQMSFVSWFDDGSHPTLPAKVRRQPATHQNFMRANAPTLFHSTPHPTPNERRIVLAQARLEGLRPLARQYRTGHQEATAHCAQAGSIRTREEEGGVDNRRPMVDARFR